MNVKLFYKSQLDLAQAINKLINNYWENNIDETSLIEDLQKIIESNKEKVFKDNQYTKVIMQRCGKRRLELLDKILNINK